MKVALAGEMQSIDRRAVEEFGLPTAVLMENAGHAVAEQAVRLLGGTAAGKKVCVFAGRGNNGGDAFVAARYLLNYGAKVRVFVLAETPDELSATARVFFSVLQNMATPACFVKDDGRSWDKINVQLSFADLIIDGIFGTGFHGQLEGVAKKAVAAINASRRTVLAIDLPSGVGADDGQAQNGAVEAAHTVTLALPKPGLLILPGKLYAGELSVASLGIPNSIMASEPIKQILITPELVRSLLPDRLPLAHKHQARLGVVAGARGTSGAAALCAEAALRAGAGLVRLFTPDSVADLLATKLTEVMVEGLPETEPDGLDTAYNDALLEKTREFPVLAVGSGLGRQSGTAAAVLHLLANSSQRLVLDASALAMLAENMDILPQIKEIPVLTPHLGEMSRLTGLTPGELQANGLALARQFAEKWRAVVVLKGMPTFVALPDGQVYLNLKGHPGLATAGSGDVLAGIIAGLAAQGLDMAKAAICGVYLHGLAAELLAPDAVIGLAAGDLLAALPKARLTLAESCLK